MKDPQLRKQENMTRLQEMGIPVMEALPIIEDAAHVRIRSAEEIARRAIACLMTIQVACDVANSGGHDPESAAFFSSLLRRFDVQDDLTMKEQSFFMGDVSQQDAIQMTWKYEAYWTLLWALGLVEELKVPTELCDCAYAIEAVSECADLEDFLAQCELRDIEEILDEADLIFRYDWACVEARIHGREMEAGIHPEVVQERHWGLNWLIDCDGENDWDYVSTNT